jgi:hypothetical protein
MMTASQAKLCWPFWANYLVRLGLCTGVMLLLCGCGEPISPHAVELKAARLARCQFDGLKPPVQDEAWSDVQLPHNLSASGRTAMGHCGLQNHHDAGIGWYRMTFSSPPGWGGVGVLVRRLSMNGEIFVNGVRVLSGGTMAAPVTRNWNTPFYVEIPAELLRPNLMTSGGAVVGQNVLDVRIYAYQNSNGGLGVVYVGDPEELRTAYVYLRGLHVEGALVSLSVALIAAFISLVAWWRMKQASMYGLFGLAMVAWALHAARYTNHFVPEVPLHSALYGVIANSAQGWFFVFFTRFLLRFTHRSWRHFEQALLWFAVLALDPR